MQTSRPEEPSIGDLFGRLADEGKAYVRAEADLYKAIALHRLGVARNGAIALVAAVLLLNAGLITLVMCFALGLQPVLGPVLAGLIVFAVVAILSFFLVLFGAARLKALGGDEAERKVLAGEKRP
jgi:hypothetical protein